MSDLISKQKVLNTLDFADNALTDEDRTVENYKELLTECIKVLTSAENKGEWEIYIISMLDGEGCKCSECGFEGVPYWNYCPNCGAKMKGSE